jgi:hypothetical protein
MPAGTLFSGYCPCVFGDLMGFASITSFAPKSILTERS